MRRITFWTIAIIVVLVFYYSFYGNSRKFVAIYGSDLFKRRVESGLSMSHLRFVVKNSGKVDAIFNEEKRICEVRKTIYHLDWKDKIKDFIHARFGSSVKLVPMIDGKIDESWISIYAECGKIIKGKLSRFFENGWLVSKIAILSGGKILAYYDPITDELLVPPQ